MNPVLDTSLLRQGKRLDHNSAEFDKSLKQLSRTADDSAIDRVISLYEREIVKLEQETWKQAPTQGAIEQYQNAFTVLEKLHELKSVDTRYNFKIIIPVADRPQHLKHCLDSLQTLCESFAYGGIKNGQYQKISVLIADDSKDATNIEQHKKYCQGLTDNGIKAEYFGLQEQLELVGSMSAEHDGLANIISSVEGITDVTDFSHKGASIMRNITYLKINQLLSLQGDGDNTLIYFIDSDQEFCINTAQSDNNLYAINFFHYLNDAFSTQDISILTGKVVGDPPVSPSVMAGNFQQDVYNFLRSIDDAKPGHACLFHQHEADSEDDAAYHDMADLFGFSNHDQAFEYHCTLQGEHDNRACFADFANKLGHFFYGEHPTRKTFFRYEDGFSATTPARTVYTGNYVIKAGCLEHFIPFASLKLRMAGPVLGRILKSSLQDKFVSANLPMLHNRTVESTGRSEFRAGVTNSKQSIDLGNEFVRQFYGDVMLFTIKRITEQGYPGESINADTILATLESTYDDIRDNYIEKHNTVLQLRSRIDKYLNDDARWWHETANKDDETGTAVAHFNTFLKNIKTNFDEDGFAFQQITSRSHSSKHLKTIHRAILQHDDNMKKWKQALRS